MYSPRNTTFQVAPLSLDFSHVCVTLFGLNRVIFTRFNTVCPFGPRLLPSNSAESDKTLPEVNTCTRPSLSANNPYQLLSSALYPKVFWPECPLPPSQFSTTRHWSSE